MIQDYGSRVFDKLPAWPAANQKIKQAEKHLPQPGQIICKHGLENYLGFGLLHKHFDLHSNERLIECFDKNQTQIKPCLVTQDTAAIPYLWKTDGAAWYPLEFCLSYQVPADTVKLADNLAAHDDLLSQLAACLSQLNLNDIYGLTLLHRQAVKLGPAELLVETTHSPTRTLTWAARDQHEFTEQNLFPTNWQFQANGSKPIVNYCGHCGHS